MRLGEARELFSECLQKLLLKIHSEGYNARLGDLVSLPTDITAEGKPRHKKGSQHAKGLAIDINLFMDGEFLINTEDHKDFGEYWESLNPLCRWGGRYKDGNHYEIMESGWRK